MTPEYYGNYMNYIEKVSFSGHGALSSPLGSIWLPFPSGAADVFFTYILFNDTE